jgi:hypothetical protein
MDRRVGSQEPSGVNGREAESVIFLLAFRQLNFTSPRELPFRFHFERDDEGHCPRMAVTR